MRERILKILEDKNLNQAEFAEIIGVNPSSISHIMNGRDKFSQTIASNTLLKFPEINPLWFLKGEGEMYKNKISNEYLKNEEQSRIEGESNIRPTNYTDTTINDVSDLNKSKQMPPITDANNKKIEKIVFFYSNQTFEEYYPK